MGMTWLTVWSMMGIAQADDDATDGVSAAGGSVGGVPARSDDAMAPLPRLRFTYESLAAVRTNPIGLNLEVRPAVRLRLYESTSTIGRDNYIDLAPTLTTTPAFVRGGVSMRVQPAAVIRLGARIEGINYFGGLNQLQSWDSPEAASWDSDALEARGEAGENYGTTGWFAAGEVLLRAKVSDFAVLNQSRLMYADIDLQGADSVFYEITYDVLVADTGFVQVNDLSTVWVPEGLPLTAGARWSYVQALHPDDPDSTAAEPIHRLGPLLAWTFRSDEGAALGNLSAFTLAQWWLKHPYRAGQEVNQALPYFVLGLSMRGDLRPW